MAVLLENESELEPVRRIQQGRGDTSLTKTVRDLLRERAMELITKGDPLAVPPNKRRARKRTPAMS
jgi:hypothetical protein